jgi:hypothetical protein
MPFPVHHLNQLNIPRNAEMFRSSCVSSCESFSSVDLNQIHRSLTLQTFGQNIPLAIEPHFSDDVEGRLVRSLLTRRLYNLHERFMREWGSDNFFAYVVGRCVTGRRMTATFCEIPNDSENSRSLTHRPARYSSASQAFHGSSCSTLALLPRRPPDRRKIRSSVRPCDRA